MSILLPSMVVFQREMRSCNELRASTEEAADERWASHVPNDILRLILKRLPAIDYLHFESVCKSWLSIASERSIRSAPQLPWLGLQTTREREWLRFPEEDGVEMYPIAVPDEFQQWKCCGATDGWMIMLFVSNGAMHLLNPISKSRIVLPSFPTTTGSSSVIRFIYTKVALSSAPTSTDCMVAVADLFGSSTLYTCRVGDEEWKESLMDQFPHRISSLMFHNGRLYLLDYFTHLTVYHCDPLHLRVSKLGNTIPQPPQVPQGRSHQYLVESGGDLLQVILYQVYNKRQQRNYQCCVLKLDTSRGTKWVETKTLGGNILFVSNIHSESISALEGSSLKPNSVYFVSPSGNFVIGFSMEDGSTQRIPIRRDDPHNEFFWFMPQVV